ncbi:MAG: phosphoenolpyruvate-protein phosphotransferase system enzyme, partial [Bacillota bacterium]|nr:phosphoenolpyruvate-protein phosphotransferase system enzyme [Bacillota bacterium]
MWQGLAAAPGIAIGPAAVLKKTTGDLEQTGPAAEPQEEEARLTAAVEAVRRELTALKERTEREVGAEQAAIFGAHLLMLDDPALVGETRRLIREEKLAAPAALTRVVDDLAAALDALPDEYLRERAADVRDVGGRLLAELTGARTEVVLPAPAIVVGADLTPSQTAQLPKDK